MGTVARTSRRGTFTKVTLALLACLPLLFGCNRGTGGADTPTTGNRGSGTSPTGTTDVYEGTGPPGSSNPVSLKPGTGRIDAGGGVTAGGTVTNNRPAPPVH